MYGKLNNTEARAIIRKWANERGLRYRITASDGVDFYGDFPSATAAGRGWRQGGWHWEDVAEDIQDGRR